MSLFIASIASGSNGNCYYIGNEQEAVLVDAGISCRETVKRMRRIGLSIEKVKAIFISHEHGDHIRGLDVLSRRYNLPVYITPATLQHSRLLLERTLVRVFKAYEPVCIGNITVHPFPKFHDAIDPHSFIVSCGGTNIGVFTDIGSPCEHVIGHFKQCHAVFLETNYDDVMLEQGRYPYHLKKRISGNEGHLSNKQALDLFLQYRPGFMSHVFLSHLSKDNNSPHLVMDLFYEHAGATTVVHASRYEETGIYRITGSKEINTAAVTKMGQMSLF
jgi:phosphoribosyl 1,2-cyclic phosphodiesterase